MHCDGRSFSRLDRDQRQRGAEGSLPWALCDLSAVVMLLAHQIFNIWGLAYHTESIRRMGPFEGWLVTPSSHRVHHATNPQYIDRNYGDLLSVFDRLFGSWVPEEEPCIYGLKKDWHSYSVWDAQTHEFRDIARDMRQARSPREALGYLLRPPGWRSSDLEAA